jgi:hypothetical protein
MLARRIAIDMNGARSVENPAGMPRLRNVMRVAFGPVNHSSMSVTVCRVGDSIAPCRDQTSVAEIYAGLGDFDRTFFWLNRSFDDYSFSHDVMGPLFDELRVDSRFNAVRRRLGTAGH